MLRAKREQPSLRSPEHLAERLLVRCQPFGQVGQNPEFPVEVVPATRNGLLDAGEFAVNLG